MQLPQNQSWFRYISLSPPVIILLTVQRWCFLYYTVLSVSCSLVITCWKRAIILVLFAMCVMLRVFCHIPIWYLGSGVALDCIHS